MDSQYFPMGFNFMAEGKKRVKIGDRKKRNRSMKLASYHFLPEQQNQKKILKPLFYIDFEDC